MEQAITLRVNGRSRIVTAAPETPLIYVLRNDLGLKGTKLGCGQEQCGACKVVIDGEAVPSCRLPVEAAADARHALLEMAARRLDAAVDRLRVTDGAVSDLESGAEVTYWELKGGRRFDLDVTGIGRPKSPETYTIVGRPTARLDLVGRVTGLTGFAHDLDLPGMLHGRIVRPPDHGCRLSSVDEGAGKGRPGVVDVVRNGSFLGVIAEREEQAVEAADVLRKAAIWEEPSEPNDADRLKQDLTQLPAQDQWIVDGASVSDPPPPIQTPPEAASTVTAMFTRPFQMHGALGPSAAAAHLDGDRLTVWSHSQGVHPLQAALAKVLDAPEETVRVRHVDGAGCYGHNGADDVALDAALLARAVPGRPVLVQWTRADEHAWEPYGPRMAVRIQASVDAAGTVVDWNHDVWSHGHSGRPSRAADTSRLLAARYLEPFEPVPVDGPGGGAHSGGYRNADPLYAFARKRVVHHHVAEPRIRTSALRGLGAYANVFAIESAIDELALVAETDPVAFRLRHLEDERAREVIEAAAEKAGWKPGVRRGGAGKGAGQGIGFAQYKNEKCYIAVVVDLELDEGTGGIRLVRVVGAADVGQIVNPDGVRAQIEGSVIQSASWTLKEEVVFEDGRPTGLDWQSSPVMTFEETPDVETVLIDRPGMPPLGCGEGIQGPVPGAIANAVFHASGIRLRDIPFTPEKVLAGLNGR